jgi:hypothetical protein
MCVVDGGLNKLRTGYVVCGAHGSACAAPFAFTDTGASPISSISARSASFTPAPETPDISSGF